MSIAICHRGLRPRQRMCQPFGLENPSESNAKFTSSRVVLKYVKITSLRVVLKYAKFTSLRFVLG